MTSVSAGLINPQTKGPPEGSPKCESRALPTELPWSSTGLLRALPAYKNWLSREMLLSRTRLKSNQ